MSDHVSHQIGDGEKSYRARLAACVRGHRTRWPPLRPDQGYPLARSIALSSLVLGLVACTGTRPTAEGNHQLAAKSVPPQLGLELTATGFFVDRQGHVLTAGHAARGCARIYVEKEGRTLAAEQVAQSPSYDLALLKVRETLGLPAVFARTMRTTANDMVFASGYLALQGVLARGGGLFNAVVASAGDYDSHTDIELVSDATHGASGAPVLSAEGLVIGVITHRPTPDRVLATNSDMAKAFLAASGITFEQDDQPQLEAFQDRARRAETISASVVCFKEG